MSEIQVQVAAGEGLELPLAEGRVIACVERTLRAEGYQEGEISLAFLDDAEMTEMNRQYLGHDRPTDVISFALHGEGQPPLGDVYVGVEQAARHAAERSISADEELLRLCIHGTLHVLGHDHPESPERESSPMFARQEALLRELLEASGT